MPCMKISCTTLRACLDDFGSQLDTRKKCILLAAILSAVLPMEIHHLLAGLVGAFGYMMLQMLEPSVQRKPKTKMKQVDDPERRRQSMSHAESRKWSSLRAKVTAEASAPAPALIKPEVRKPSAMPVQAPKFESAGWDAEVEELIQQISPGCESRAAVQKIAALVRRSLSKALPGADVDGFATSNPLAGTAFGVAVPEVDIVVTLDPKLCRGSSLKDASKLLKSLIRTCTDELVSCGAFKFRRSAFRGTEPKVTLIAPAVGEGQTSMPINLSVNAASPARSAALFEACGQLDSRAQALMLLVRRWAKDRGISHAAKGHIAPYGWMMLAVYYMQVRPESALLPALDTLVQGRQPKRVADNEARTASPAQLFKGFLNFYTEQFDWRNEAISVRLGRRAPPDASLALHMVLHENGKTTQVGPSIEDPFESGINVADCMNWLSLQRLHEELKRGQVLCSTGASLSQLLEPWSPPEASPEQ